MNEIPLPVATEYFILSVKEPLDRETLLWWGPDNSGYTYQLDKAGRYSREKVLSSLTYYHNSSNTLAIPCQLAEQEAVKVVRFENPFVRMINDAQKLSGYSDLVRKQEEEAQAAEAVYIQEAKETAKHEAHLEAIKSGRDWDPQHWENFVWDETTVSVYDFY